MAWSIHCGGEGVAWSIHCGGGEGVAWSIHCDGGEGVAQPTLNGVGGEDEICSIQERVKKIHIMIHVIHDMIFLKYNIRIHDMYVYRTVNAQINSMYMYILYLEPLQ